MLPQEFKYWLDNCVRDARANGMSNDDILVELMEQVKRLLIKKEIEILSKK